MPHLGAHALLLVTFVGLTTQAATINTVSVSNLDINALTVYTWNITFDSTTPRSPIQFTFPTAVTLSSNTTVTIGGSQAASVNLVNSNEINITTTDALSTVYIVFTNVLNPNSVISTHDFALQTSTDGSVVLSDVQTVTYVGKNFASCPWSFSACTESPASTLTVTVTTVNPLPAGSNQFRIYYKNNWAQHEAKSLTSGVATDGLTCRYS